jgi:hypothetical protein
MGVALVHTKGRLTEYGKDLIEAIKKSLVLGLLGSWLIMTPMGNKLQKEQ